MAAPPDGVVAAEMDEQIEHVMDAVLERVIAMGAVDGGPAVAAHVQGDAAEAEGGEAAQLVAPAIPEVRPTVDEDDERAGLGAAGEIETRVAVAFREVLSYGEEHKRRGHKKLLHK